MDSFSFSMRLNRCQEGDLFADHHHHGEGRRRRRRTRREELPDQEDTLELSAQEPEAPAAENPRLPPLPSIALAGDPAAQVASYWLKLLDEESS